MQNKHDNPITLEDLNKPVNTGYPKTNEHGDDDWATPSEEEKVKEDKGKEDD